MLQLLREKKGKQGRQHSFECQDDDLFSEEEEETRVEKVKRQRGDEEDELKEEVVRGQDTGIDVYSLGESISTIQLFSFQLFYLLLQETNAHQRWQENYALIDDVAGSILCRRRTQSTNSTG